MTKSTLPGLVGGLTVLLALALPVRATEEARAPGAYAVLVGVGHYSDAAIKGRPHAEDDVKALYDLFTGKDYLGVPKDHVRLLLGGAADKERHSQEATRDNILAAARWVATEAGRDDLVVFALVGQGAALGERGDRIAYLATDSGVKDLAKTGVLANALGEDLDKLKSHRVCMFVDVYFKGYTPAGGGSPADPNAGAAAYKEFLGKDNTEEDAPAPGRALFLAGSGRYPSPDGARHGSFTEVLLDGLQGKADREGDEPDGTVTADELAEYLNRELPPLVRKLVADEKARPRHAVVFGEDAHLALTHNPAVAARVKERLDKFATLAGDKKLAPEVVQEGKALLERMPRLEAQRTLRKEYQALVDGKEDVARFLDNRAKVLDSTKLADDAAREFAEKVLEAIKLTRAEYVKEVNEGQMVDWAIRGLYRKVDEKVPEDVARKLADVRKMKDKELVALLADVRQRLGKRKDLENHKDLDQALLRMLHHLDPYTTFYTPDDLKREEGAISGQFIGVGIQVRTDPNSEQLQVITPILGSPAYDAGIQAGDVVTTITRTVDEKGKPLEAPEVTPTKGLDIGDAVKAIQGKPGTPVKLTVRRPGVDKPLEFEVPRREVHTESVLGIRRKADASWDYFIDSPERIAYVRLTQFQRNSTHALVETMAELKKQGVRGLVLDLRNDPGGFLDCARDVTDLFIDDGVIVEVRPRVGESYVMRGRKESIYVYEDPATGKKKRAPLPSYTEFPMAVLVDGKSASASEIVSAALQDHHRALVLGERSYGKGSVQNVVPFEKEGEEAKSKIKLTTASFWRPSKKNLNKASTQGRPEDEWGVTPDRVIPLEPAERSELYEHQHNLETIRPKDKAGIEEKKDSFKDKQLDAALEYLRGMIKLARQAEPRKKAG